MDEIEQKYEELQSIRKEYYKLMQRKTELEKEAQKISYLFSYDYQIDKCNQMIKETNKIFKELNKELWMK